MTIQATAVGRYAIQLAKLSGMKVATTASPSKWDTLKKLGADLCVDYKVSAASDFFPTIVLPVVPLQDPNVTEKLKQGTTDSIECGLDK